MMSAAQPLLRGAEVESTHLLALAPLAPFCPPPPWITATRGWTTPAVQGIGRSPLDSGGGGSAAPCVRCQVAQKSKTLRRPTRALLRSLRRSSAFAEVAACADQPILACPMPPRGELTHSQLFVPGPRGRHGGRLGPDLIAPAPPRFDSIDRSRSAPPSSAYHPIIDSSSVVGLPPQHDDAQGKSSLPLDRTHSSHPHPPPPQSTPPHQRFGRPTRVTQGRRRR